MFKYSCTNCQYLYIPTVGDEEQGIPPKVLFESLPENWCCPHCQESIDAFTNVEEFRYEIRSTDEVLSPEEEMHVPFFREEGELVYITIGRDDNFHPDEPPHAIEFVGLYLGDEPVTGVFFPNTFQGEEIVFDTQGEDWDTIVSACSLHGEWSVSRYN